MKNDAGVEIVTNQGATQTVVLPCAPDQFRNFIASLLGRPQTISRELFYPFDLTRQDAENLHHLISQRIGSQNDAVEIQFIARIVFHDGSSILLNSFTEFQSLNEIKPLVSVGVYFSWTYLIRFQKKEYPEKQQIDVSFLTGQSQRKRKSDPNPERSSAWSKIEYRVAHTDRTWGADIDALLESHLRTFEKTETPSREFVSRNAGWIGFSVGVLTFLSTLGMAFAVTDGFVDRYLTVAKAFDANTVASVDVVAKKIDFLISVIASGIDMHSTYLLSFLSL